MFVHLHAHCAWTTTEQSTYFRPIVMGSAWVDQTSTNPLSFLPINTIERHDYLQSSEISMSFLNLALLAGCKNAKVTEISKFCYCFVRSAHLLEHAHVNGRIWYKLPGICFYWDHLLCLTTLCARALMSGDHCDLTKSADSQMFELLTDCLRNGPLTPKSKQSIANNL